MTDLDIRLKPSARKHGVPDACTISVVLGHPGEPTTSYTGTPSLRWRGRLDADRCHILDVLAEDHTSAKPPRLDVFHSQPIKPPGERRGKRNRRR